jgi:adenine deaminase
MKIAGQIVDIVHKRIYAGEVDIDGSVITNITELQHAPGWFILPGFIDAHVHIESSMMVPAEFARMAVVHGTVATISDPHEIANVMGIEGVRYMIDNGKKTPFKFYFGAPSCVPATIFETAGAEISANEIEQLFTADKLKYLAEMMNWPGVLYGDPVVKRKIELARKYGKVVDGHAPGLRGEQARDYIAAGIGTDHECFSEAEALDKLKYGMKIIIREGSAARNFDALINLVKDHPDNIMFCSDDKHPDSLEEGHVNVLVKRAIEKGLDLFKVLQAACLNPIDHYQLEVGRLRKGDRADFIVVKDLRNFEVVRTYIDGSLVAENGKTLIPKTSHDIVNNFSALPVKARDFEVVAKANKIRVIEALDGQLITNELVVDAQIIDGKVVADIGSDVLKIAVVNRYQNASPAVAFIRNFNLKRGAIASSVGHDSHNIIAVGTNDNDIAEAINLIIKSKGGVSIADGAIQNLLRLPVAGIMSDEDGYQVSQQYKAIDRMAKDLGCTLASPYMTLSFMALLVIPSLKLSDKGLFNGNKFTFTDLFVS